MFIRRISCKLKPLYAYRDRLDRAGGDNLVKSLAERDLTHLGTGKMAPAIMHWLGGMYFWGIPCMCFFLQNFQMKVVVELVALPGSHERDTKIQMGMKLLILGSDMTQIQNGLSKVALQ